MIYGTLFLLAALVLRRFRFLAIGLVVVGLVAIALPFAFEWIGDTCQPCP